VLKNERGKRERRGTSSMKWGKMLVGQKASGECNTTRSTRKKDDWVRRGTKEAFTQGNKGKTIHFGGILVVNLIHGDTERKGRSASMQVKRRRKLIPNLKTKNQRVKWVWGKHRRTWEKKKTKNGEGGKKKWRQTRRTLWRISGIESRDCL